MSNKNSTLTASSLKLRSVFFIFQKIDFFATRMRFQTFSDAFVKRNNNDNFNAENESNRQLKNFSKKMIRK